MKDNTHQDQIIRWALFVKNNPDKWKSIHTEFINAQFEKSEKFYKSLSKTEKGKKKIIEIFNIKNIKDCPSIN